jgi:FMN phosphatase YigB (HAD superfamily)
MDKHILTDCDGVLLRWEEGFDSFITERGHPRIPGTDTEYSMALRYGITMKQAMAYIKEYNESDAMASLKPFADSVEYVAKLANMGFRFTAVTSMSDHPDAKMHRTNNLKALFGDVFDEVVCLEMGASKAHVLMRWADSGYYWIEDHMRQAEAGHEAGLRTVLINHPYNNHYKTDLFPVVSYETPWKDIYKLVCNTYYGKL